MRLLYHAEAAAGLWAAALACMIIGTFLNHNYSPEHWGLFLSAGAATMSVTYYARKNRRRMDRCFYLLGEREDDGEGEKNGPTGIAN